MSAWLPEIQPPRRRSREGWARSVGDPNRLRRLPRPVSAIYASTSSHRSGSSGQFYRRVFELTQLLQDPLVQWTVDQISLEHSGWAMPSIGCYDHVTNRTLGKCTIYRRCGDGLHQVPVHDRSPHDQVRTGHVNLGSQYSAAVREFANFQMFQQVQVFLNRAFTVGGFHARLQISFSLAPTGFRWVMYRDRCSFPRALSVVYISKAFQPGDRPFVQPVEISPMVRSPLPTGYPVSGDHLRSLLLIIGFFFGWARIVKSATMNLPLNLFGSVVVDQKSLYMPMWSNRSVQQEAGG